MRRGEIWVGNLNPDRGAEIGRIRARDRLEEHSQVITEQPRTVDRARLTDGPLARLTVEEMAAVERSFRAVTGLV